jgi:SAM-dependent methyltransferase
LKGRTTLSAVVDETGCLTASGLARCIACGRGLAGRTSCEGCGRTHPEVDGILHAIDPPTGRNRVAAAFYDGPTWSRFKFWEQVFLWFQGPGIAAARDQVLRHLPKTSRARVLEVGIGDGENLRLLPKSWEVFGVDLARGRLRACLGRYSSVSGRLAWAEAEALPFEDASFDAVFTVGGINYFRDPAAALREMSRVARPGAALIAADEIPNLHHFALGHMLGLEAVDRLGLRLMGIDREFIEMVYRTPPVVESAARDFWPGHRRVPIWNRLGYCLISVRDEGGV